MSHYAELHVNYNGHTDTYYSRKFLVMDEVPIAGEGNVIDVFPHVMNFEGRPGVKFNSYLVRTFDEEAYNEALEKVTLWGISGDVVDKKGFYHESYVAIERDRDALVSFARSGSPFLFVDELTIVDYTEFKRVMKEHKKYLDFDLADHVEGDINDMSKQELFMRHRDVFKELYGVDNVLQHVNLFDSEEYWKELSEERRDAFYHSWQSVKHLFKERIDSDERGTER